MQAQFQSPPPGPRKGFAFSSDFKNPIWPHQNSTICAQGPNWAWLKDVTPAYLFEVAFYKFWRQRATAIAKILDGAVKPCWHDGAKVKTTAVKDEEQPQQQQVQQQQLH